MEVWDDMSETYVIIRSTPDLSHKRPQFVYEERCPVHSTPDREVICQLTSNVNETGLWCARDHGGECPDLSIWTRLKKCYAAMGTRFATVWQDTDTLNLTTGRVETDPRKFAQHLADESKRMEDRLGQPVDFQPTDPTDLDALGVTDEGLDATHDQQVRAGLKDSRGRFVWTI